MTTYAGIDYGFGVSNVDKENGIRYGVINQVEILQAWADSSEPDYPSPYEIGTFPCPECDREYEAREDDEWGDIIQCRCGEEMELEIGDLDPIGFTYQKEGYQAACGDDGDIFVIKSPYFTYCQFCSPCAPGAGCLTSPFVNTWENSGTGQKGVNAPEEYPEDYKLKAEMAGFPKVYCFSHDWFEEQETGEMVDCPHCQGTGLQDKGEVSAFVLERLVPFDDNRVKCWNCLDGWQTGSIGKVKEVVSKAPYPVFDVKTGEIVNP